MKMEWLEALDRPRRKYCKEEFALIIMFLLMLTLFFSRPEVIGYASTNIHNQGLELLIDSSQAFYLKSVYPTPVHVTSVLISGEITGEGTVSVYLDNENGNRALIFNNQKREGSRINRITGTSFIGEGSGFSHLSGLSVTGDTLPMRDEQPALELLEGNTIPGFDELPEGRITVQGKFTNSCVETCLLQGGLFNQERFKLVFMVEPGTQFKVTELTYTTLEEI